MQASDDLTDDQAQWLKKLLIRRARRLFERFTIPDDVLDTLYEKGLVRRWRDGDVEITLDGICLVARRGAEQNRRLVAEKQIGIVPST